MPLQDLKKRNHFIPITYLKGFLNDSDNLYMYKKGKIFFDNEMAENDRILKVRGVEGLKNIGVKNLLYIPEGAFEGDKNVFEDFFEDEIESKYSNFINFINDNFYNVTLIMEEYHEYIIKLIATMLTRTLHSKFEIEEMYKVSMQVQHEFSEFDNDRKEIILREFKNKFPNVADTDFKKAINSYDEMISKGDFEVSVPRNLFLKKMFKIMEIKGQIISNMTIQILRNKTKSFFITSDNPAVYFVREDKVNICQGHKSLGGPDTQLYFPLSKDLCLFLSRKKRNVLVGLDITHENKKIIREVNNIISHNSKDFIYSPNQASFLKKFTKQHIPYPYRFRIS